MVHLIGDNGGLPTDLEYKKCPLCGKGDTMMPRITESMSGKKFHHCVQCNEEFDEGYLIAFWRGFQTGLQNAQPLVTQAQMEQASANRMIWAVAYAGENNTIRIDDAVMAMAGDPTIVIHAERDEKEKQTIVSARFMTESEKEKLGLQKGGDA